MAAQKAAIFHSYSRLFRRDGVYTRAEAGFVTASGVLMNHALLDRLIDHRGGRAEAGFGGFTVALLDCLAQRAQCRAQAGLVGAVHLSPLFGLTGALKRRKMVCHF